MGYRLYRVLNFKFYFTNISALGIILSGLVVVLEETVLSYLTKIVVIKRDPSGFIFKILNFW